MTIIIIGAGVVGAAVAYYLTEDSSIQTSDIHIIESDRELFASASGFAGGFLARDWFPPATAALGDLSFELHKRLAQEHDGTTKWGYRRSIATSLVDTSGKRGEDWIRKGTSRAEAASESTAINKEVPPWLNRNLESQVKVISSEETTAQV